MPTLAQRASLEPPDASSAPSDTFHTYAATPAPAARASVTTTGTAIAATPASTQTLPATGVFAAPRQRNRHTPRVRLDATLDITLSRAAVSTLAITLAMSLPLPWRVETIRPIRRDTAAVVSIALPRIEASRAMHVVMQSLPEAEFGALRLRPAV